MSTPSRPAPTRRAVAYLELRVGDRTLFGVGMDANIVSASLKAIVSGLQRRPGRETRGIHMADQLIIFDTTLRDGEQSPGAVHDQGREAAHRAQLERLRWT